MRGYDARLSLTTQPANPWAVSRSPHVTNIGKPSRPACPVSPHSRTKGKGWRLEGAASADRGVLTNHQIRKDQHGPTGYRSHRPLAGQPGEYLRDMDGRRTPNRSIMAEPQYRFTPRWTLSFHPPSRRGPAPLLAQEDLSINMKDHSGKEPKERAGLSNDGEAHSTVYRTPNRYHRPHCLWNPPTCYHKTIAGSNIPELRLDRTASRRLMAVESAPAKPLGCMRIWCPRTSTVGAELREARTTVFQECATPARSLVRTREGKPDTTPSTRALDGCWYEKGKTKENPQEQECPNGKRTKEKRR